MIYLDECFKNTYIIQKIQSSPSGSWREDKLMLFLLKKKVLLKGLFKGRAVTTATHFQTLLKSTKTQAPGPLVSLHNKPAASSPHFTALKCLCHSTFRLLLCCFVFHQACFGTPPELPSPLAVKIFHQGCFWTPPPHGGPAWLIIKCLSCQALQQHPNLFWQLVLHIHSLTYRARKHVSACTCSTLSKRRSHTVPQTVYQSGCLLGERNKCCGPGAARCHHELKVVGTQLEAVAQFQISLQVCKHTALLSCFCCIKLHRNSEAALNACKVTLHS